MMPEVFRAKRRAIKEIFHISIKEIFYWAIFHVCNKVELNNKKMKFLVKYSSIVYEGIGEASIFFMKSFYTHKKA